jgi:hypothetical protein
LERQNASNGKPEALPERLLIFVCVSAEHVQITIPPCLNFAAADGCSGRQLQHGSQSSGPARDPTWTLAQNRMRLPFPRSLLHRNLEPEAVNPGVRL